MLTAVRNAMRLPDLRNKILITLGILAIYRAAAAVPVPTVDLAAMQALFQDNALLGFFNMLSGGALENFSVLAMGDNHPLASNATPAGKAKNRRMEIVVYPDSL